MATSTELRCAGCGRPHASTDLLCGRCGKLLPRPRSASSRAASAKPSVASFAVQPRADAPAPSAIPAQRERLEPWLYLGIGLVTAPVFALTPFLGFMGWFLASL